MTGTPAGRTSRAPLTMEVQVGDEPIDVQDFVRAYVRRIMELEGSAPPYPSPHPSREAAA